jgi:predicted DCC family thiol-disulfide oxidoreductase YuxK
MEPQEHPVILFDGVCNLCNGAVQFVIARDPKKNFRFASLQSSYGQAIAQKANMPTKEFNSFILFEKGLIYTHFTGALKVTKKLSGGWPLLYLFIIVPKFIRDAIYNFIGKNRYRWFGKQETCWVPTPDIKLLFLD